MNMDSMDVDAFTQHGGLLSTGDGSARTSSPPAYAPVVVYKWSWYYCAGYGDTGVAINCGQNKLVLLPDFLVLLLGRLCPLLASVRCVGHVAPGCGTVEVENIAGVGHEFALRTAHTSWNSCKTLSAAGTSRGWDRREEEPRGDTPKGGGCGRICVQCILQTEGNRQDIL